MVKARKKKLGKYEYPLVNFGFEKHSDRLKRDRKERPVLDTVKYTLIGSVCPDCGGEMLDEYKGHYACERCPYVAWKQPLVKR